jgi:SMC interacting uncharacterized protein involved in chromosome segregation
MLKKELEEQNERLQREHNILNSALRDMDARLERHEHSIAFCRDATDNIIILKESFEPFQNAVENWIGIVRETLEIQSRRIDFVEERAERLEKSSDKHELYYRGLTQTTRRFARYLKIFERKIRSSSEWLDRLDERVDCLHWLVRLNRFFTRWTVRR